MAARSGRRVLVVDDDAEMLSLLADLIAAEGHMADAAPNGKVALERLAAHEYDLILCDIRMPELDGPGLYEELERRAPHLLGRFIFIAADAEGQRARLRRFLDRTGVPVIAKPFTRDAILRALLGNREAGAPRAS